MKIYSQQCFLTQPDETTSYRVLKSSVKDTYIIICEDAFGELTVSHASKEMVEEMFPRIDKHYLNKL